MKLVSGLVFCLLLASTLFGQSAPAPDAGSAPSAAAATNAGPAPQPNPAAPQSRVSGQTMSPAELNAMRMGQLMRLSDDLKAMRTKLDEMKANAAKVKDPTLKQQLQLDNELWAMMLSHVQQITASAAQHPLQRQAQRQVQPPATSVAPAAPESKPAAPADHP